MNCYEKEGFIPVKINLFFRKAFMITKCLCFFIVLSTLQSFASNDGNLIVSSDYAAAPQQAKTITGTVTDQTGETMVGTNIMVQGTSIGGNTDIDGKFTINNVPANAVLIVTSIGYKEQQIRVGAANVYNIVMEENTEALDEVVVVGYGVTKKQTLAGAVSSIRTEEILQTKTENLVTNLQGKVSGLLIRQQSGDPGNFNNLISIRGYGAPLFVIDGVIRDRASDFAQLNPEDVENISILKDASAAIYGMNASNGVIVVTTRKGHEGKARVTYSGMYGLKMPTGMDLMMNAYDFRLMDNEMARNTELAQIHTDATLEKFKNGEVGYQDWDWIDMYLHDMVPQNTHSLTISGGSDKVKYFASYAFNDDNGLYKTDINKYKRHNFRANFTAELTKGLSLYASSEVRFDTRQDARDEFIWNYKTLMVNDRGVGPYTLDNPNHLSDIAPEQKNAAALINKDIEGYRYWRNIRNVTLIDLRYEAPFLKGLEFLVRGSFETSSANYTNLQLQYQLYDYTFDTPTASKNQDRIQSELSLRERTYAMFQTNYRKKFGSHDVKAMFAVEGYNVRNDNVSATRQYADLYTNDIVNQGTSTTASNGGSRSFQRTAAYIGSIDYNFMEKYIVEASARYNGTYRYAPGKKWTLFPIIKAAWRLSEEEFIKSWLPEAVDQIKVRGSYGESGRDSGSAFAWIAGYSANAGRGSVLDGTSLTTAMTPPGVTGDKLSWITSTLSNVGIDVELKKGLLSGSFELFQRKNTGILTGTRLIPPPNTFGASLPDENLNSDMNLGMELELGTRGKIQDFSYSVNGNITYARQKRLHIEQGPRTSSWNNWTGNNVNRLVGRSFINTYSGRYTSLEEYETAPLLGGTRGNSRMLPGSFKIDDTNGDGRINDDDRTFSNWTYGDSGYDQMGSGSRINPPLQYGLTLQGNYKNFDLTMLFQGAALYSIQYSMDDIWGYGRFPTLQEKFFDRWRTTDPTADPYDPATKWTPGEWPALRKNRDNTTDGRVVDVWRPNGSYLRFKNIELGYTVPRALLNKAGISRARIYFNTNNIFTICNDKLKGSDPERQEADYNAGLAYPIMKAMNVGVNITF